MDNLKIDQDFLDKMRENLRKIAKVICRKNGKEEGFIFPLFLSPNTPKFTLGVDKEEEFLCFEILFTIEDGSFLLFIKAHYRTEEEKNILYVSDKKLISFTTEEELIKWFCNCIEIFIDYFLFKKKESEKDFRKEFLFVSKEQ